MVRWLLKAGDNVAVFNRAGGEAQALAIGGAVVRDLCASGAWRRGSLHDGA
jgi:hypothetical protein